eukprot:m.8260 g.8260  ORF g.8260 m.8260 type:complete len:628 (+) comp20454_c0_seq2:43-1926(+)
MAIVVDRGPEMQSYAPRSIEIDVSKIRGVQGSHEKNTMKLTRSLWSFAVEGAVEYLRILYDLFPPRANIVVVNDEDDCTELFEPEENRDVRRLQMKLSHLHALQISSKHSKSNSEWQRNRLLLGVQRAVAKIPKTGANRSHVIILTSLSSENLVSFPETLQSTVKDLDESVEVICVNICRQTHLPSFKISDLAVARQLKFESVTYEKIFSYMCQLVKDQYNLQSTIITGIPMKEDQQMGASANYDVELLHESNIYLNSDEKGNQLVLRWSTPRNPSLDVQQCPAVVKITPVDVMSRHALCLIQFLLHGRAVLLESKPHLSKAVQYTLVCHGGTIYLHCFVSSCVRSPLEDPPSVSEGYGGRVTDYRIKDFGDLMKSSLLVPLPPNNAVGSKQPISAALQRMEKVTRYWPLVLSDTVMFNLSYELEPLLTLIQQDFLSDSDVMECTKVIHQLQYKEAKNEPLSLSGTSIRGKGPRREELYRQLWDELHSFLEGLAGLSRNHNKVYASLKETRPIFESVDRDMPDCESVQSLVGWQRSRAADDGDQELNPSKRMHLTSVQRRLSQSSLPFNMPSFKSSSLLDLFKRKEKFVASQRGGHEKFAGELRQNPNSSVTELYPELQSENGSYRL